MFISCVSIFFIIRLKAAVRSTSMKNSIQSLWMRLWEINWIIWHRWGRRPRCNTHLLLRRASAANSECVTHREEVVEVKDVSAELIHACSGIQNDNRMTAIHLANEWEESARCSRLSEKCWGNYEWDEESLWFSWLNDLLNKPGVVVVTSCWSRVHSAEWCRLL